MKGFCGGLNVFYFKKGSISLILAKIYRSLQARVLVRCLALCKLQHLGPHFDLKVMNNGFGPLLETRWQRILGALCRLEVTDSRKMS